MVFSTTMRPVWKSAYGFKNISPEDVNFPKICDDLDTFVSSSFEGFPRPPSEARGSLGLSSLALNGAARLYSLEANRLLADCHDLYMSMICPTTGRTNNPIDGSGESSEMESESGPFRNSRNSGKSDSSSRYLRKRHSSGSDQSQKRMRYSQKTQETPSVTESSSMLPDSSPSASDSSSLEPDSSPSASGSSSLESGISSHTVLSPEEQINSTPIVRTVDVGIQTNKSYLSRQSLRFDENLPFGYITVFDNIHDKLPSKIILSSLNANVRNL